MQKSDFIRTVKELNLDPSDYVVIGSGVLCALGLRDADDVDVIVSEPVFVALKNKVAGNEKILMMAATTLYMESMKLVWIGIVKMHSLI